MPTSCRSLHKQKIHGRFLLGIFLEWQISQACRKRLAGAHLIVPATSSMGAGHGKWAPATQATTPGNTAWQSYGEPGGWISSQTLTVFSKQSPKPALKCVGNFEDECDCLLSKLCSLLGCPWAIAAAKFLVS